MLDDGWAGVTFAAAPIPERLLSAWAGALDGADAAAALPPAPLPWAAPPRNPYLPRDFELHAPSQLQAPLQPPVLLRDAPRLRLWHRCRVFEDAPVATVRRASRAV